MRLDKYLKVSRLIKRRTVANEACDNTRVTVNGKPAKASYDVKVGDHISIAFGARTVTVEVLAVAEAGGDDYEDADEEWIVYTAPGDLMAVVKELEAQGIQVKGAEMTMIANTPSAVSVADAKKVMRLIDKLEELEDLQAVYHTMDITDEIAEALDE